MKKLITYTGILFSLGILMSKAKSLYDQFDLSFSFKNIRYYEFNLAGNVLTLLVDIYVKNINEIPVFLPINIETIKFYLNNIPIATATVNISDVFLASGEIIILKDVQLDLFFKDYKELYHAALNYKGFYYTMNYTIGGKIFQYSDKLFKS